MASFLGEWQQCGASENFEEFLKAIGIPEDKLKNSMNVRLMFSQDGDTITQTSTAGDLSSKNVFKFGEEFEFSTLTGQKITATVVKESDAKFSTVEGSPIKYSVEIIGDEAHESLVIGELVATRVFKKV